MNENKKFSDFIVGAIVSLSLVLSATFSCSSYFEIRKLNSMLQTKDSLVNCMQKHIEKMDSIYMYRIDVHDKIWLDVLEKSQH